MRLLGVKCIVLACIATTLASEPVRPKRDLQFWKEVIAAKLGLVAPKPVQKEEYFKIVKVPKFEQVVVRAPPKVTVVEAPTPDKIVQVQPTPTIIGPYVRVPEQTFLAIQGTKQLNPSGLLNERQEFVDIAPQKSPLYILSPLQHSAEHIEPRPVFKETVVPVVPYPGLTMPNVQYLPPVPVLPSPPERMILVPPKISEIKPVPMSPTVSVPVRPLTVVEETIIPKFSYKLAHSDGALMSYLSRGNKELIITETRQPPPKPPTFIIDRLQKIIFGEPLGNIVPAPYKTDAAVIVSPIYSEASLPISTEQSSVAVKVNNSSKKIADINTNPKPIIALDIPVAPAVVIPPKIIVEAPTGEEGDQDRYKHVHADGTVSNYSATTSTREPYDIITYEHISSLPPPPPELLRRIGNAAGKAHKPWGWGLKMSNGVGTYSTLDEGKIYYSHLDNLKSDLLPDPLSSLSADEPNNSYSNIYMISDEDRGHDEFRQTFLSNKVKDESNATGQREFEAMKKFPPLPMPIAGDNQQSFNPHTFGAAYAYKIVTKPNSPRINIMKNNGYRGFDSDGFTYTYVNHNDTTVDTYTEKRTRPVILEDKQISAVSVPMVEVSQYLTKPPVVIDVAKEHHPAFSHTQVNRGGGSVNIIQESERLTTPLPVLVSAAISGHNAGVIDISSPVQKSPCKHNKCKKPHTQVTEIIENSHEKVPVIVDVVKVPEEPSAVVDIVQRQPKPQSFVVDIPNSRFSYTQVNNGGLGTKTLGNSQAKSSLTEIAQIPRAPATVIDVVQSVSTMPKPVLVEVNNEHPRGEVMFKQPVLSSYVYKQISHRNPQHFTVVETGEAPAITIPVCDGSVNIGANGAPCSQFPKLIPDSPIPLIPMEKVVPTVPIDLIYIPPLDVNKLDAASTKVKINDRQASYTDRTSSSPTEGMPIVTKKSTKTSKNLPKINEEIPKPYEESPKENEEALSPTAPEIPNNDEPISFDLNPIVVAESDEENSISETKENDESNTSEAMRGDLQ